MIADEEEGASAFGMMTRERVSHVGNLEEGRKEGRREEPLGESQEGVEREIERERIEGGRERRETRGGVEGDWSATTRKTMIPLDEQREVQTVLRAEVGGRRVKNNKWTYETDGGDGIGGEAGDAPCAETVDGMEGNG